VVNSAFGRQTANFTMNSNDFIPRCLVPNEQGIAQGFDLGGEPSQRPINENHALGLARYIVKGEVASLERSFGERNEAVPPALKRIADELGRESYYALAPIVANIRPTRHFSLQRDVNDSRYHILTMASEELLRVIDGQHRTRARVIVFDWLKSILAHAKYPAGRRLGPAVYLPSDGRLDVTGEEMRVWGEIYRRWLRAGIEISLHIDLDSEQERQLFFVLNKLGLKVDASLAFEFDEGNAVNQYIKNALIDHLKLKVVAKDRADRDEGEIALKDLIAVNAILFLNKTNVRSATPVLVEPREGLATKFWQQVTAIPGFGLSGARKATVAAQPVLLKALAKLVHDFAFGREQNAESLDTLLSAIPQRLDLSHSNPAWRYYSYPSQAERDVRCPGLAAYLPPEGTGNRDLGGYDANHKVMNFGAKHNDIFPLLGDIVRWTLKLPARQHRTAALPTEAEAA
jgi:hypothetical protein